MSATEIPRVGVTAVVQNADGKFLVSKRKGSHGAGTWQFPGGHLEHKENLMECAERETEEETGLKVKGMGVFTITNDIFTKEMEVKHYITIFAKCVMTDPKQEPRIMEPEKCDGWHWKSWEELKAMNEAAASDPSAESLFLPIVNLMKQTSNLQELIESRGL